jgi:hypothetical protein
MNDTPPSLQALFLETKGQPIFIGGNKIILMDRINIPSLALVKLRFLGDTIYRDNAAVIAVRNADKILLSDNSAAKAVAVWDEPDLPREVSHIVESENRTLEVYNKYRIRHSEDFVTEDSFTGNAGMHVIEVTENRRRYECSNGPGPVSLEDLVFELWWEPLDALIA